MTSWTEEDIAHLKVKGRAAPLEKKRGKYRNQPTEVDGHTFPSIREADRYRLLKAQLAAGEISELELQPRFPLHVRDWRGISHVIGEYIADFRYRRDNSAVVEDSKGMSKPSTAFGFRRSDDTT
jgi:hypothetical protein